MQSNTNIADKKYRKLTISVSQQGFSYAITDTLNNRILMADEIDFTGYARSSKVEDHYWKAFIDNRELTKMYDEIVVLHNNSLNTFVPKPLFDDEYAGSYLQYNTKVFETDFFATDAIENSDLINVYIPYVNINNYLIDQFGPFEYRHTATVLVEKLLDLSRNIEDKQVYAHLSSGHFEIVVVQNRKLLLYNAFEYTTAADFIYYLLFTAEQLQLNPEHFRLQLLGTVDVESELFRLAYKYVRNVSLLDVSELQRNNTMTEAQNLKNFILFQS